MLIGIVGGVPHPLLVSVMAVALRPSRRRSPEPDKVAANEAPGVKPALTATCEHEFGGFLLVSKLGKGSRKSRCRVPRMAAADYLTCSPHALSNKQGMPWIGAHLLLGMEPAHPGGPFAASNAASSGSPVKRRGH